MKSTTLLFALFFTGGAIAQPDPFEGMPFAERGALRMYADVGKKTPLPLETSVESQPPPGQTFTVRVYLQNRSEREVTVLLGTKEDIISAIPNDHRMVVLYSFYRYINSVGSIDLKPPLSDLRPVQLARVEAYLDDVWRISLAVSGRLAAWHEA